MSRLLTLIACLAVPLASCCTNPKREQLESPEVAARCPPVKDLLSKNYHRDGKVDLAVVNIGGLFDRTGAILSGEEAARVTQADALCRAWVYEAISDRQYAEALMKLASVTIVETSNPGEHADLIASFSKLLEQLKKDKIVPPEVDTSSLPAQVDADAKLAPEALVKSLERVLVTAGLNVDKYMSVQVQNQVELVKRLDALDERLARLGPKKPDTAPTSDAEGPAVLEIYFSTKSSEVTYDGRARLREAAKAWRSQNNSVTVLGYADPRGSATNNAALSKARADAVAKLLRLLGVNVREARGGGIGSGADDNDMLRVVRVRRN